jgi:6-phosphogluconolactonase
MAIHADLMLAYVIFELESFIGVYSIDPETGALSEKFMVGIMAEPSEADYASEIEISPNQKQLYASNRGNGAILVYDILSDAGDLSQIQVQYVGGPMPRHFKVHPDGKFLLVALQESNKLELYQIDQDSGVLGPSQTIASDNNPTIVAYLYI